MDIYSVNTNFYVRHFGRFIPPGSSLNVSNDISRIIAVLPDDERLDIKHTDFNHPHGTTWAALLASGVVTAGETGVSESGLGEIDRGTGSGYGPNGIIHDISVNQAKTFINHRGELILQCDKHHYPGELSGNFNGGGKGNKPIAAITGFDGLAIGSFPILANDAILRSIDDADEEKLGVSYNAMIDLSGTGAGPIVVMVITKTLNAAVDIYAETGLSASVTSFDINAYSDGGTVPSMANEFYIVGNLPSYAGALLWFDNPINLSILLSGGTMPVTGEAFSGGFPNAKLVSCASGDCLSTDGGLPVGRIMTPIWVQSGGSSNAKQAVTAISTMTFDGNVII